MIELLYIGVYIGGLLVMIKIIYDRIDRLESNLYNNGIVGRLNKLEARVDSICDELKEIKNTVSTILNKYK